MNNALKKQILADLRRNRRLDLAASVLGWSVTIVGASIGACIFYAFAFIFLSIGV